LLLGICLQIIGLVSHAAAQNLRTSPSLAITGGYNDNILFNNIDEVAGYYTSLKPILNVAMTSARSSLDLFSYTELFRYLDQKELDYEIYRLGVGGRHQLTERLNFEGGLGFTMDTTLESELEETGRVVTREDRERTEGQTKLSYDLSEVSEFGLEYRYRTTKYDSEERIDRIEHRLQIPYRHRFNDQLDQVTLRPAYTRIETEDHREIDYYNISIGWTHIFSKTMRMTNFIGYQYTVSTTDGYQDIIRAGNANLSIIQTGELFSYRFGLRSNIYVNAEGNVDEVDRIFCRLKHNLTEKLSAQFYGSVYVNRQPEENSSYDSLFYDLKPELSYRITPKHSLNTFYQYSYEMDQTVSENQESIRNVLQVYVLLRF